MGAHPQLPPPLTPRLMQGITSQGRHVLRRRVSIHRRGN